MSIPKNILQRPRPEILRLIDIGGFSFPSGHSTFSMAIYGYLMYILKNSNIRYKNIFITVVCLMILAIGFSRIYLGVHYFSDVFAGFLSGLIVLNIVLIIEKNILLKE